MLSFDKAGVEKILCQLEDNGILDEDGNLIGFVDGNDERYEEIEGIEVQMILMEKLDSILKCVIILMV